MREADRQSALASGIPSTSLDPSDASRPPPLKLRRSKWFEIVGVVRDLGVDPTTWAAKMRSCFTPRRQEQCLRW